MDNYIVPASLHDDQGIMGCIKLGLDALGELTHVNGQQVNTLKGDRRENRKII